VGKPNFSGFHFSMGNSISVAFYFSVGNFISCGFYFCVGRFKSYGVLFDRNTSLFSPARMRFERITVLRVYVLQCCVFAYYSCYVFMYTMFVYYNVACYLCNTVCVFM